MLLRAIVIYLDFETSNLFIPLQLLLDGLTMITFDDHSEETNLSGVVIWKIKVNNYFA